MLVSHDQFPYETMKNISRSWHDHFKIQMHDQNCIAVWQSWCFSGWDPNRKHGSAKYRLGNPLSPQWFNRACGGSQLNECPTFRFLVYMDVCHYTLWKQLSLKMKMVKNSTRKKGTFTRFSVHHLPQIVCFGLPLTHQPRLWIVRQPL